MAPAAVTFLSKATKRPRTESLPHGRGKPLAKPQPVKPSRLTFLNVFQLGPIADALGAALAIKDIISLTRTCKQFSQFYRYLIPTQWNVDLLLRRFVDDPQNFRAEIGKHSAIISGSLALEFFARPTTWQAENMAVFVQTGRGEELLKDYIINQEGYKSPSGNSNDYKKQVDNFRVFTYTRLRVAVKTTVQIVETPQPPLLHLLVWFPTTVVFNFLTWSNAYSLFPLSTFVYHKAYMTRPDNADTWKLVVKYGRRGWIFDIWRGAANKHNNPMRKSRSIGDSSTWTIPLPLSTVKDKPATPDTTTHFRIRPPVSHVNYHLIKCKAFKRAWKACVE